MSSVAEIEEALRQLPPEDAKNVAIWLQHYLQQQPASKPEVSSTATTDAFSKWRGKGRLPVGQNVDDYLRLTRDGDRD